MGSYRRPTFCETETVLFERDCFLSRYGTEPLKLRNCPRLGAGSDLPLLEQLRHLLGSNPKTLNRYFSAFLLQKQRSGKQL